MLRKKLLPTFNAVAEGQPATCDLPLGQRYHTIWLKLGDDGTASTGQDTADKVLDRLVGLIRVKIGGQTVREFSGSELNRMNAANGAKFGAQTSGAYGNAAFRVYLPIFFGEPWRKDIVQQQLPAWNMQGPGVSSFQVEVNFLSGATLGAPVVTGMYEWEQPTGDLGVITKVTRQGLGAAGTQQDFNILPWLTQRDFLQSVHLFPVTGTVSYVNKVKLTANQVEIQDLIDRLENDAILNGREMNPTALDVTSDATIAATGLFNLVLDYDDPLRNALPAAGLKELTMHCEYHEAANGTLICLVQRAGPAFSD